MSRLRSVVQAAACVARRKEVPAIYKYLSKAVVERVIEEVVAPSNLGVNRGRVENSKACLLGRELVNSNASKRRHYE